MNKQGLEKSLEFMQSIINRVSGNSLKIKAFSITIESAVISFLLSRESLSKNFDISTAMIFVILIFIICFSCLDAYYLSIERQYRYLYNKAIYNPASYKIYDLKITKEIKKADKNSFTSAYFSISIILFYLTQILAMILAWIIIK